jgi:hypothetical protein
MSIPVYTEQHDVVTIQRAPGMAWSVWANCCGTDLAKGVSEDRARQVLATASDPARRGCACMSEPAERCTRCGAIYPEVTTEYGRFCSTRCASYRALDEQEAPR